MDSTFNPYADLCQSFDVENAPKLRRANLLKVVREAAKTELDSLWIGRDLGYRGGRRTGLAFTDDVHLDVHGERWGIMFERATRGEKIAERTATVLWDALGCVKSPVFLWNVFPLHPHIADQPFSNRAHNAKERLVGIEILAELIDLINPARLLPIGKDAAASVQKIRRNQEVVPVRHPSFGGQRQFLEQVAMINRLSL